ncbi:RNA-binding protein [Thalassobium sp. R2A62]|jgi:uncharacterized protein|uniref:RNA-binding protein n=1 Tax=Thalassobium sp. R2A62 TaxID=633131 RepID=UPI0001B1D1C6|nr:RNA-binding protein [Thalassobium sp. R2A62]EET47207.1 hypothetical protein TR2A62_2549 [Thalassobium sp. R2A62]MDG1340736.1 RNA-binding protein [Paracoccaceae bacterium]MDG1801003.1 RNA-binding protein [Paracoccaceae bacterium]MDG2453326.1 RNA-binding protein [Paracoccaceae bacterium]
MSRGGRDKDRDVSERKCVVTGEVQPKAGLIRFVVGPDDMIVPDVLEKLPGRGIWVTSTRDAIETATTKKLFARGAKQQVSVPDGLVAMIDGMLARRVVDMISMSRKTGRAVTGFEKVKSWLANDEVRVLLQASDGSERGKAKLWTPEGARYFGCLTAQELGLAFGRQSVIHAALAGGGLSDRVVEEAAKLRGLRENESGKAAA